MAKKKQNRRSVSMKRVVYARLHNYCTRVGRPVAAVVEELLVAMLDEHDEPEVEAPQPKPQAPEPPPPRVYAEDIGPQYFTF